MKTIEVAYLSTPTRQQMQSLAMRRRPHEAVGVLVGPPSSPSASWVLFPLRNESATPDVACEVSTEQLKPHMERWREEGMEIHAWWHSHPNSAAVPSDIDLGNTGLPLMFITTAMALRYESQRTRAWTVRLGERAVEVSVP